jgi:molybdopterin/thiamine biosynthesis adenylyltransferase
MNSAQHRENIRSLASILGIGEEDAAPLLAARIQISWNESDVCGRVLGEYTAAMLSRTFETVGTTYRPAHAVQYELVINNAVPISDSAVFLYATVDEHGLYCGIEPHAKERVPDPTPRILLLLSACFCAAQVASYVLRLPLGRVTQDGVELDFALWPAVKGVAWERTTDLGKCQLAGAGAVGNALLYALQFLPVKGEIAIFDPKKITGGIVNRCLWFDPEDIGFGKATTLARKANNSFKDVTFSPYEATAQGARAEYGNEFNCLLVGVDSRLSRRQLQSELPYEVFDASTTGVEEVVFHHNVLFTGQACLACIYNETDAERRFESHVAETLNVTLEDVATGFISIEAARRICTRYPHLDSLSIVGVAFDSLFKQLCSTQMLVTVEQKQVLAPFAFVSQLAGTVQAIEMFLRRQDPSRGASFNYWRVNPWRGIVTDLQQIRPSRGNCALCSQEQYKFVATTLWGEDRRV